MVFTEVESNKRAHRLIVHDKTMEETEEEYSKDPAKKFDAKLAIILYKYRDILDKSYHLLFSGIKDLENLIRLAPDFFIMEGKLHIPDIARLLDIEETLFLDLLERNEHFVNWTSQGVMLNRHLRGFLSDRKRSKDRYCNPRPHHFAICLKIYNVAFDLPRLDIKNMMWVFCIKTLIHLFSY